MNECLEYFAKLSKMKTNSLYPLFCTNSTSNLMLYTLQGALAPVGVSNHFWWPIAMANDDFPNLYCLIGQYVCLRTVFEEEVDMVSNLFFKDVDAVSANC